VVTLEERKDRLVPPLTHNCGFLCWLCLLERDYGIMQLSLEEYSPSVIMIDKCSCGVDINYELIS
jgi:hypothetical protein